MAKLMSEKEAEEIINAMLDEYGLIRIRVVDVGDQYQTPDVPYFEERRFLCFKWKKKIVPTQSWVSDPNLLGLVLAAEAALKDFDYDVECTDRIRQQHASRLLEAKLEERNGTKEE